MVFDHYVNYKITYSNWLVAQPGVFLTYQLGCLYAVYIFFLHIALR